MLDPKARALLDQLQAAGAPPLHELPVETAREGLAALFGAQPGGALPLAAVEDRRVPGPAAEIPVRVYRPEGRPPLPLVVFFHGGGWVLGDLESHDGTCRALARAVPAVVVAVDYRLAPEHKFPAAAEDAFAATRWAAEHATALGGDAAHVAVAGDSAGGNLAAVVALMARDRGGPRLVHQVLVYPATDAACDTASHEENAEGYFLTRDAMRWFWAHYLPNPAEGRHPYASPLRAEDLRGLPPALVITAEYDPLRDEGEAYAARLRAAGVSAITRRFDGMIHAFLNLTGTFPEAAVAIDAAAAALRAGGP